jgi:ubiquinone/menaquinone biosynthesis C-methylase UbiE
VNREAIGRRFARLATDAVVRYPPLWRLFRGPLRRMFNGLAPVWNTLRRPDSLASFEEALERVEPPRRALDIGTGTGAGAELLKRRFPSAEVVGVDLAPAMIEQARASVPGVRFEVADASRLPYEDASFELVTLSNMIPFFDELARVVAPGGHALIAFSSGAETPIYVPLERLEAELRRLGFMHFAPVAAGRGTALLAQKGAAENTSG